MSNITNKTASDPRWGAESRDKKAQAILVTLSHFTQPTWLQEAVCIDIGCGSGGIAFHLAPHVQSIVGIDPEPWERWEPFKQQQSNLQFRQESADNLTCATASIDLVICNQVYEHVPDPNRLIAEIYRILKLGGYCYFAGPNLLFPVEPHVFWPFIHWLPRSLAVRLMRLVGSKAILDAYSTDYWRLKRWLGDFTIFNAVPYILKHPERYGRSHWLWRGLSILPESLLNELTWLSPGFVFVLQKPTTPPKI